MTAVGRQRAYAAAESGQSCLPKPNTARQIKSRLRHIKTCQFNLAAQQCGDAFASALIWDLTDVDAGERPQEFTRQVSGRGYPTCAISGICAFGPVCVESCQRHVLPSRRRRRLDLRDFNDGLTVVISVEMQSGPQDQSVVNVEKEFPVASCTNLGL